MDRIGYRGRGVGAAALLLRLVLSAAPAVLAGCGTPADKLPPVPAPQTSEYRLGPGDQVRLITFGEVALTGEFRISDSGRLALPLTEGIDAQGLTTAELSARITQQLKASGLYRDPKVAVEVSSYRPIFILGEVAKPGQYSYQPGMTTLTAAAIAGGFTYRAVTDRFSVVRRGADRRGAAASAAAAAAITAEGRADRETVLQPGDVVTVFERVF